MRQRLEPRALILLDAADDVPAADRPPRVLLALEVPADPVAPDLDAAAVLEELDVAVDATAEDGSGATLHDLDRAADARAVAHDDEAGALGLDVADHADAPGHERGAGAYLQGSLNPRAVERAAPSVGDAQVDDRDGAERAAAGAFLGGGRRCGDGDDGEDCGEAGPDGPEHSSPFFVDPC